MTSLPTVELVRKSKKGEDAAREELFRRYYPRVQKIVRMRLGAKLRGRMDSGDVTQDVFMAVLKGLETFELRGDASLIGWMATIAVNRIRGLAEYHIRGKRDMDRELAMDAPRSDSATGFDTPDPLPTPSVELGRAEDSRTVQEAIAELPERYREAILAREYIGSKWADIAEELGVGTPSAARMLYSRGLSKLEELLARRGVFEGPTQG